MSAVDPIASRRSRSASEPNLDHPRWDRERLRGTIVRLLREGRLEPDGVLGPFVSLEGALDAYREVLGRPGVGIKLTVTYDAGFDVAFDVRKPAP